LKGMSGKIIVDTSTMENSDGSQPAMSDDSTQ
jgi:hypothetical protein